MCNHRLSSIIFHLQIIFLLSHISHSHHAVLVESIKHQELTSCFQAMKYIECCNGMAKEIQGHESNNILTLCSLQKWTYKIENHFDGCIAKGYSQVEDL